MSKSFGLVKALSPKLFTFTDYYGYCERYTTTEIPQFIPKGYCEPYLHNGLDERKDEAFFRGRGNHFAAV